MLQQKPEFDATQPPSPVTLWERVAMEHVVCLAACESLDLPIQRAIEILRGCRGKILICGNGGSAAQAQHFAAELVVRFETVREPIAALALTTDTSILTAAGNDFGYHDVFRRQVEALARPGDILVAISTSGKSANVYTACQAAGELGCVVIALTGQHGMQNFVPDIELRVPCAKTSRIQEIHTVIIHALCEGIEA